MALHRKNPEKIFVSINVARNTLKSTILGEAGFILFNMTIHISTNDTLVLEITIKREESTLGTGTKSHPTQTLIQYIPKPVPDLIRDCCLLVLVKICQSITSDTESSAGIM